MKLRRTGGAAIVVALLFLATFGAGSALAAPPTVVINSPGVDVSYDAAYPTISGSITQEGPDPQLTSASVALSSNDGWSSENATQSYPPSGNGTIFTGGGASITYSWVPKPRYNGKYTVTVTGTGRAGGFGGSNTASNIVTRSFFIALKPVAPIGVAASMDDSLKVAVTWKANPEPDVSGYQVFRSYQNGNPAPIGAPVSASTKPTFTDDLSGRPAGAYKYAVQAIRRERTCATASEPACTNGIRGDNSAYSSAVTVRGTGATTTTSTTIKKGTGGTGGGGGRGGTGGGSTGGGSTSTTAPKPGTAGGGRSAPRNTGGFAPGGNVDLSQFGGLLGGNGRTPGIGGAIDEGTYDGELPYDPSEQPVESSGRNDDSLISIGGTSVPAPNEDWVKFIGAGSFVTALLVHVLWFKQQVDALPLEAID